jgi:hypothetical protein
MSAIYYHHKRCPKISAIEHLLRDTKGDEELRRFCVAYTPDTHAMADFHPLRHALPRAWNLDVAALRELNTILPGVIYEMPRARAFIIGLTTDAVRSTDKRKRSAACNKLRTITVPVHEKRDGTPITPHMLNAIDLIMVDFFTVRFVFKREQAAADITHAGLVKLLQRTFEDIPPAWIVKLCQSVASPAKLSADRLGELAGYGGRGLYEQFRRVFGSLGDPVASAESIARDEAAAIELPY